MSGIGRPALALFSLVGAFRFVPVAMADAVRPVITVTSPTYAYPIPVAVTFRKDSGPNVSVTDFDASDLTITNGAAVNFSGTGHTYNFDLEPSADPASVTITIAPAAATGDGNASVAGS
ncbi:MAG: hypothetical protein O3B25_16960, partial [Verrucomicrobia bacterium]|nr:hypothetical protein [Verrucomicrobiota bacterium]